MNMEDFFADLHDNDQGDDEPSFSLHEFRKWLSRENKKKKSEPVADKDDAGKQDFKDRLKKKRNKD